MRRSQGALLLLVFVILTTTGWTSSRPENTQVFNGEIMDSVCAHFKSHKHMMEEFKSMGSNKNGCVRQCREQLRATYVLYDPVKEIAYEIADPDKVARFPGRKVRISGALDKNQKIDVVSILAD
ncbi:MAG TPA: hypothetical protein VFA74_00115 [Terriglobales bacterium]|nr:hypothetical protein [Terriglobales bacterium]